MCKLLVVDDVALLQALLYCGSTRLKVKNKWFGRGIKASVRGLILTVPVVFLCPRSAGQILRAVINDHMTCYNLNWPKIKL